MVRPSARDAGGASHATIACRAEQADEDRRRTHHYLPPIVGNDGDCGCKIVRHKASAKWVLRARRLKQQGTALALTVDKIG